MDVRDPWPFSTSGDSKADYRNDPCLYYLSNPQPKVHISSSEITVYDASENEEIIASVQIKSSGANVTINNSEIVNTNGIMEDITAITSGRGKLSILNGSVIEDFQTGIVKLADIYIPCGSRGLLMRHASILEAKDAIINTSQLVGISHSFIEGNVTLEGLSHSSWRSNNISSNTFIIQDPQESTLLNENLFDLSAELYSNNSKTFSLCNEWNQTGIVVFAVENAELPPSWGLANRPSGNKYLTMSSPTFLSETAPIINYSGQPASQQFQYLLEFTGQAAQGNAGCVYSTYPTSPPIGITNYTLPGPADYQEADIRWKYLDSVRTDKEESLATANSSQAKLLLEEIASIQQEMSDTVRVVLTSITDGDDNIDSIWLPRSNSGVDQLSELRWLWYSQDFDSIQDLLKESEDADVQTLLIASEVLRVISSSGRNLFQLLTVDVDTLSDLASASYGDYTNILRDFLCLEYNVRVPWPLDTALHDTKPYYQMSPPTSKPTVEVFPNPSSGCVYFNLIQADELKGIYVYDYLGNQVTSHTDWRSNKVCIDDAVQGLYVVEFESIDGRWESIKLIVN